MKGQMPRISALVIFCKSDNLQSRWQLNPSAVEKIETSWHQNARCPTGRKWLVCTCAILSRIQDLLQFKNALFGHFFCFLTTFCCCVAYFRFLCNIFLSFLYFCSKIVNTRQKWGICCELATTRLKKNVEVILRRLLTPCLPLTSDFTNTALCLTRCVWVLILF